MSFLVNFTMQDDYNRRTTRRFTNTRALLADALTDTSTMIGYLEALSGCAVVKADLSNQVTYATSPDSGANEDAGGTLHVRLNNGKLCPIRIPAFDVTLCDANGNIDITDSKVTDLTTALGSGGHWTISEGNTVTSVESGELDR